MKKLLSQIFYNNDFLKRYYKKQFGTMYRHIINNLKGGGFNIEYKDITIKFDKIVDEDRITLYLSTIDEKDNCIMIIIDKDTNTAYIEGITNNKYNNCFNTPELNNGKTIMDVSIKMLKKYKDKLNIKTINLRDNSFFQCSDKVKIWLSDLSFLQYNDTFYGRLGFMPLDKDIYKKYLKNQAILELTLVKSINITKILNKYTNINSILRDKIYHNYERHKDYNIVQWFNKFSKKYMVADCKFFNYVIEYIYNDLKLNTMKGESFELKL